MNRFKKEIRKRGFKLEQDYDCLPHGDIDGVGVVTEECLYWLYHYGMGFIRCYFDRSMREKWVYED